MDANARTCMRGVWWADRKVMGAYGRDELNDNGKRLSLHPRDNKFALLNTNYVVGNRTRFKVLAEERSDKCLITY